jgi:hypothetical protein
MNRKEPDAWAAAAGRRISTGFVLVLAALLMVPSLTCEARVQKKTMEDAWRLEQRNSHLGAIVVYAGASGVKVTCIQSKGTIVASAPDWRVVAYNTEARSVFESSCDAFLKNPLPGIVAVSDHFKGQKPTPVMFSGIKALVVKARLIGASQNMMIPTWSGVEKKYENPNAVRIITFIASQDAPGVAPRALEILRSIYKCPKVGGFPLAINTTYPKGDLGHSLKTYKFEKVKVEPRTFYFHSTKGYSPARTAEVTLLPDVSGLFGVLDE